MISLCDPPQAAVESFVLPGHEPEGRAGCPQPAARRGENTAPYQPHWWFMVPMHLRKQKGLICERGLLRFEQIANTCLSEIEHFAKLCFAERGFFSGALQLNEFTRRIHHQVQIDCRASIFRIAQVQQSLMLYNANTYGRDSVQERSLQELARYHESLDCQTKGDVGAGDGCGACPAIGLKNVAVNPDSSRP